MDKDADDDDAASNVRLGFLGLAIVAVVAALILVAVVWNGHGKHCPTIDTSGGPAAYTDKNGCPSLFPANTITTTVPTSQS